MTNANAFTHLCDLTDDLRAQVQALPESLHRVLLLDLVREYDALIEDLIGFDLSALARAEMEDPL